VPSELYVASAEPYFFSAYALPLVSGETPSFTSTSVNEPVPVAQDSEHLYVGSFDDGVIYQYNLPLPPILAPPALVHHAAYIAPFSRAPMLAPQQCDPPQSFCPGLAELSGLAVTDKYLYVAGSTGLSHEVLQYALPLTESEVPSGSVIGFSYSDFLGIAAQNRTLYVASTTAGTVGAYALPLTLNQQPKYTISTASQDTGATGVAIDRGCHHLYVSLLEYDAVYVFKLPYITGVPPTVLHVNSSTGSPYGIAISASNLFVTAGDIFAYPLPLTSESVPDAVVPFSGFSTGVTTLYPYLNRRCG
jgi:hypothetical protein